MGGGDVVHAYLRWGEGKHLLSPGLHLWARGVLMLTLLGGEGMGGSGRLGGVVGGGTQPTMGRGEMKDTPGGRRRGGRNRPGGSHDLYSPPARLPN